MSNLVPLKSMLGTLNRWPNFWDDDDLQLYPSVDNGVDIYETENEVVVKANIAGVSSDDVDVTFEKGSLWIQAKSTKEEDDDKNKYYSKSSRSYSYKIAVPGLIDHSKEPEVTLENGILKVEFIKSEASKPKKLSIKTK
ncbi:Hsp20/alpha crystallin family protein [Candidatus Woesebacteria bacterium]|nr:Hsp20/alpha crystallin family protein [Candidatus Woesebacteria bacterium]